MIWADILSTSKLKSFIIFIVRFISVDINISSTRNNTIWSRFFYKMHTTFQFYLKYKRILKNISKHKRKKYYLNIIQLIQSSPLLTQRDIIQAFQAFNLEQQQTWTEARILTANKCIKSQKEQEYGGTITNTNKHPACSQYFTRHEQRITNGKGFEWSHLFKRIHSEGARMELIRDTNRNSKVNALEQHLNSFPRRRSRPIRSPVSLIYLVDLVIKTMAIKNDNIAAVWPLCRSTKG